MSHRIIERRKVNEMFNIKYDDWISFIWCLLTFSVLLIFTIGVVLCYTGSCYIVK